MSIDGIVLVDKPSGPTSHDVVAIMRKLYGTRKVGHAGTLDPMATGMLVIGIGRATRLLGYFTASDKEYLATIRLGMSTTTDDAQGELVAQEDASSLTDAQILEVVRSMRGHILQRPSSVSAIKVDGKRAYAKVRAGEEVELESREVNISDLEILKSERVGSFVDVDVRVTCSAGTYVRALARDIGAQLGVGGHLIALRRTRSGAFDTMMSIDLLRENPTLIPMSEAVRKTFPAFELSAQESARARNGVRVSAPLEAQGIDGPLGIFDENHEVISLAKVEALEFVPLVVFVGQD